MELAEYFANSIDKKDDAIKLLNFNLKMYPNSVGSKQLLEQIKK
jgi:hypothetical protein